MTKHNFFRITLSVIFALGWTFSSVSEAAVDPLVQAYEDIQKLQNDISKLSNKTKTEELLNIAIDKYEYAIDSRTELENAQSAYDQAVEQEDIAYNNKALALSAVDGQTVTVETALQDKNNALQDKDSAQDVLDIANINLQTAQIAINSAGNQGWQFAAYTLNSDRTAGSLYCTGVITQAYQGMPVCGRYENLFVVFSGKITAPDGVNVVSFAGYTDDGFRMYVDGQLVINQWVDQGSTWSPYYYHTFTAEDRVIDVVFHYFNGGGPGVFHVGWGHSGIWTGVASSAMSYGQGATQAQINAYNEALAAKQEAQANYNEMLAIYNNKLSYYNQEVQNLTNLTQNLTTADENLTMAQENLTIASENLTGAETNYENAISDMQAAVLEAQKEYNKQWQFEEDQRVAAAIAQALASQAQPQPTPEPSAIETVEPEVTPEPTPDPQVSPEQTEQDSANQQPDDQTTDGSDEVQSPAPEQSQEPQPEPTPQQTDISPLPTPTPQPTPTLSVPSPKPSPSNTITPNLTNIIANLTSKDNVVVKLTPEQMKAVGSSLASLSTEAKVEVAKDLGVNVDEVKILAEAAQDNPAVAAAIVTFAEKAEENADAPMPYTIADAITEAAAELFLEDPLAVFTNIDFEALSDPSQWGKDMTDDQREKAQEVIVPVILVSNIVTSVASALSIRRI